MNWGSIGKFFLKLGSWCYGHKEEVIGVVKVIVEAKAKK